MSGYQLTHIVFFVLDALLEMMRETKNVYPVRLIVQFPAVVFHFIVF